MASSITTNSNTVTHQINTSGDITINLILTIKLEGSGLSIGVETKDTPVIKNIFDEDSTLLIPEIKQETLIGNFGKKV